MCILKKGDVQMAFGKCWSVGKYTSANQELWISVADPLFAHASLPSVNLGV